MTLLLTPAARSYDDLGEGGRMKLLLCPKAALEMAREVVGE
jgi:hypothetical protein